jgi:aspartate/glutamate racemase
MVDLMSRRQAIAVGAAALAVGGGRVDGVILGCTELPLLQREDTEAANLISPSQLLAGAAVKTWLG